MNRYYLCVLLLGTICVPEGLRAQAKTLYPDEEQEALETLTEIQDQETEDDEGIQEWEAYRQSPLDINEATAGQLGTFTFLTPLQIASFIQYRQLLGKLVSIYELQAVPGFDLSTIKRLLPYIKAGSGNDLNIHYTAKELLNKGTHVALLRYERVLEKSRGYRRPDTSDAASPRYLGSRDKWTFRYRYQFSHHISYGITADKDPGEEWFHGHEPQGFDFYSAHLFMEDRGKLKALALGDFVVNMGQGLLNWQSLSFSLGGPAMSTGRNAPLLKPYASPGEIYFYRGAGATFRFGRWDVTAFASYRPVDANLVSADSISTDKPVFSSLQSSGYHRTESELADKHSIMQWTNGANISYRKGSWHAGLNAIYHHFSGDFEPRNTFENLYDIRGSQVTNASFDYGGTIHNFHFFGETAWHMQGGWATVNGFLASLDEHLDWTILYRNFGKRYRSLYGNAFGESSRPENESGLYTGIAWRLNRRFQVNAYADIFQYPWLHYRVNQPSGGHDYLVQWDWQPSARWTFVLRSQQQAKPLNIRSNEHPIDVAGLTRRWRVRLQGQFDPDKTFSLRTRAEWISYSKEDTSRQQGLLLYQDVIFKPAFFLSGDFRLAWFQTGGYDARIYTYERNVLYAYSIPFLYGRGFRWYVNLRAGLGRRCDVWIRIAQTVYRGGKTIGSGLDEINGNRKTTITLQLRWKLDKNK